MATTPVYGLRFQALTDQPHGPNLGQDLALDVEDELVRVDAAVAARALQTDFARRTPSGATVATLQTTTSTGYVDLATVGPQVTVTTSTAAMVFLACAFWNSGGVGSFMSFAVSGATTLAASDANALIIQNASLHRWGVPVLVTGLTPGSNTFTAKYRVAAGTGNFQDRHLIVVPV